MTENKEKKVHYRKCGSCGKINSWAHGNRHETCQKCGAIHWEKPRDECLLFNLQEEYLLTRNEKTLGKMYLIMFDYAQKIILKQLPFKYDETKLEEKTEDAVTTIIRYYLTKPDYKILFSFGAMLFGPTRQELFKKKQKDIDMNEISYDSPLGDDSTNTFKDKISSDSVYHVDRYSQELVDISNKVFLIKELSKFVDSIYASISKNNSQEDAILSIILLHHFLNKKDSEFFDKFYLKFGTHLSVLIEKEKIILFQYIEDILKK